MIKKYTQLKFKLFIKIFLISFLLLFLSLALASVFYLFQVAKKLKSGEITRLDLLEKDPAKLKNRIYGINRPQTNSTNAQVNVVIFTSFGCEACREASMAINKIRLDNFYNQKANFIIRQFPSDLNYPFSTEAALASECAHRQGRFFDLHNALFDLKELSSTNIQKAAQTAGLDQIEFKKCVESVASLPVIEKDIQDGLFLGVKVTPSFIINSRIVEGAPKLEDLKKAIDLLTVKNN